MDLRDRISAAKDALGALLPSIARVAPELLAAVPLTSVDSPDAIVIESLELTLEAALDHKMFDLTALDVVKPAVASREASTSATRMHCRRMASGISLLSEPAGAKSGFQGTANPASSHSIDDPRLSVMEKHFLNLDRSGARSGSLQTVHVGKRLGVVASDPAALQALQDYSRPSRFG